MKKLILALIIIFCAVAYSQNNDKGETFSHAQLNADQVLWKSFQKTLEGIRTIIVADSNYSGTSLDTMATVGTSAVKLSTLIGDTTVSYIYLYNNSANTVYISTSPTVGSSGSGQVIAANSAFEDGVHFYKQTSDIYLISSGAGTDIRISMKIK